MMIVPATEQMLEVQICLFELRVVLISGIRGAMANQMKKAVKKQNHEHVDCVGVSIGE